MDIEEEGSPDYTTESERNKTGENDTFRNELSSLSPEGQSKQARKYRKRKVSFPDDSSIISKSVEPVDPWADVSNATSSEVIKAYINSCGRLRVKPIDKLIKQLKEHAVFHGRINCLDLKGVKLDLKSCEAMEEVFKKVQFYLLDIENTNLEDEGAIALVEMVEFYHSAVQIHIGYNPRIKTRGWQTFSQMVRKAPFVEFIDLRHCCFNDACAALMARSLRLNSTLRVLHLEGDNLSGKLLIILCTGLKLNQNLAELFLGDNFLVPSDAATLAAMLKLNTTLQLLDVRNNMLQDQGLMQLCDGLHQQNSKAGLRTLVLWNNQITRNGMVPLGNYLATNHNIQTINVGHNRLGNDGIRNLQVGLLKNRGLLRLGLLNTKITAEGAVALAEYIADTRSLLRLDLRENDLFVGGLMALTLAVKINESVVRIDLDKDLKKEQGMEDTQTALLVDIYQHLEKNKKLGITREEEKRKQKELEIQKLVEEEQKRDEKAETSHVVQDSSKETLSLKTGLLENGVSEEGNSRFTVCKVVHPKNETTSVEESNNGLNLQGNSTVVGKTNETCSNVELLESPSNEKLLEFPRNEELQENSSNAKLQDLSGNDKLQEFSNSDELQELSSDDKLLEFPRNEEIQDFSSDDRLQKIPNNDELQGFSNDVSQDISNNDQSTDTTSNDGLKETFDDTNINDNTKLINRRPDEEDNSSSEEFDKEMDELLANVSGVKIDLTELPSPQDDDDFWNKDMQEILESSAN